MDPRAIQVFDASAVESGGLAAAVVNGERLETPAGNPVQGTVELIEAMVVEFLDDGVVDVTRPSSYAFYSAERDFIAPDPSHSIDTLVELLAHDYLVHSDERLGRRQAQMAAWKPQIALWQNIAQREPPFAPPDGEPDIHGHDYGAFRAWLSNFSATELSVAIHAANILKSATLGFLLAKQAIDASSALEAAAATLRMHAGDTREDLEREQEWEEDCKLTIDRLLRYASLAPPPDHQTPG